MEKPVLGKISGSETLFLFWCPGCEYSHHLETKKPGGWEWNGDLVKPTASPSLLVNKSGSGNSPRCHFFIRDGKIQYCGDSTHGLAGKTVDMVPYDEAGDS